KTEEKEQADAIYKHTLFNVSQQCIEQKNSTVTEDYAKDIWSSFELHVFPSFGSLPISMITAEAVILSLIVVDAK
ncbi:integrase, partial [Vibrio parahaemolyticus]|nr:integrase [Vibrio parahaemolyticus]